MVELSQSAVREIKRLQLSRQLPKSFFRLGIQAGGCSGFCYTLEFCDSPLNGDRLIESSGLSIIIDERSYPYIEALKLDFSEDLMGGGFRFHNPQAFSTCSCGISFSLA